MRIAQQERVNVVLRETGGRVEAVDQVVGHVFDEHGRGL